MELALYCPVYGYYEKEKDNPGRRGDFFTSVSVGSLFGEMLAFQFAEWLEGLDDTAGGAGTGPHHLSLVEAGAHDGGLARDILTWLRGRRAPLFDRLEYCLIEPSARRRLWQEKTLADFAGKVRWVALPAELNSPARGGGVRGIIFSNELLDALPVLRLGWDAKMQTWFEWGVGLQSGTFVWRRMPAERNFKVQGSKLKVPALPRELTNLLPDGFTTEICPAAEEWWHEAAVALHRGMLLTIDYGLTAEEFFTPERSEGTLRAYTRHHLSQNLLANPGEQDLTAHVNFTAIRTAGEAAGLRTDVLIRQEQFLTRILERVSSNPESLGEWTPARARQFQTLTHPEHLGRPFRVLIQSRVRLDEDLTGRQAGAVGSVRPN